MTGSTEPRPLEGLRVADFASGIAGPHVGLLLAHHGAEVIKIEPPEGDWSRVLGCHVDEFSPFSVYYNRGKRSVAIDLKSAQGREAALEIARQSDIVIESFRPGVMKRLALDYERLKNLRPDIVYLSMSGFGQDGPNAQLPATDTVIQGYSGLMSLNSDAEGAPQRFPAIIIDVVSGLYGFQAVMGAIVARLRWGRGAYLDCSLLQSGLALQAPSLVKHRFERGQPTVMYVPLGVLQTQDSHVSISVNRDAHFVAFCRAIERPELAEHPDYATLEARIRNEKVLMRLIRDEFRLRTTDEWVARLQAEGILHARIRSYDEVLEDQELQRAGMLDWLQHSALPEALPIPNIPIGPRAGDYGALRECPRVGQHSREVLTELGFEPARIQRLLDSGAVLSQRRLSATPSNSH
ncbi:CoA transferase [uncultured Hydrogenophaga sp.]|uniref:CaiB/BaiF CoA transferase family protein n=1 Tax=uncultured Hydrogenophaga sp. TaxID=199683 RepID=UPI002586DA28|nr:CoA transferase [uncultured Hydrogenophaga sp.]